MVTLLLAVLVVSLPLNWAIAIGMWVFYHRLPKAGRPEALRLRGQAQGALALVWTLIGMLFLVPSSAHSPTSQAAIVVIFLALDFPALSFAWFFWRNR